jgi:hypothetical protein
VSHINHRSALTEVACWLLAIAACAVGCSTPGAAGGSSTGDIAIECQVFYRPSPGESFQEAAISLGPENATRSEVFDGMVFTGSFFEGPGEGPSLSLAISDPVTEDEMARQLYQIDQSKGLTNQFIGGHGFTGLVYIFHPGSPAELQYFCSAQ